MNKIQKGKTALVAFGIIGIVLGLVSLIVGIILVSTCSGESGLDVLKLVFGILLILLFFPIVIFGVYFTWMGGALKATNGSVVEDNLGKGTMNKALCNNCGCELHGEKCCPNCGKSTMAFVVCEQCGMQNPVDNTCCGKCGKELKK